MATGSAARRRGTLPPFPMDARRVQRDRSTFAEAGGVRIWTKADSVTRFDRIAITPAAVTAVSTFPDFLRRYIEQALQPSQTCKRN